MAIRANIKSTGGSLKSELVKQMGKMSNCEAHVGFMEGDTYPDGTLVAEVAMYNELGAPRANIPERSFMRSTEQEKGNEWLKLYHRLVKSGTPVRGALEAVGERAISDIRAKIKSNISPANKESTLAHKQKNGAGSVTTLIDTGVMFEAVRSEVVDK